MNIPQPTETDWLNIERELCERSLAEFTRRAWHIIEPGAPLVWNWHLDVVCAYLEAFYAQRIKKLIISISPGCMKSVLFSVMGPAWAWAKWPHYRMLNMTNEQGLAIRDSMRMRSIITSDWYQPLWPEVQLTKGQDEKTLYENTEKGFRQSLGITGNVSGKRGNFLLLDDPIDVKKAFSDVENKTVNDTYDQACANRLNSLADDCIGLIAQRCREDDLPGHILAKKKQKWVHLSIPMEYEGHPTYDPVADLGPGHEHLRDPRTEKGELMFPARFPRKELEGIYENLGEFGTAAQYQQRPIPLSGGIIKKKYWTPWPKNKPFPICHHVFDSWDTAYTERDYKDAAYSARTTWGVFEDEATGRAAAIILGTWHGRVAYPELKAKVKAQYKNNESDLVLVERKASGISLHQDLRRMRGITIRGWDPGKMDKVQRANLATPMMEAGLVYYPPDKQWAKDLIAVVAKFPTGAPPCKDLADTVSQALLYVRRRGWMQPPEDEDLPEERIEMSEEDQEDQPKPRGPVYG